MAYDEKLADAIRRELGRKPGLVERKMFGGIAFLIHGNMSVGIHKNELIVRLPPDETDAALREPGARIFDVTGRPMQGWVLISAEGTKKSLGKWVKRGVAYASSLPKKPK